MEKGDLEKKLENLKRPELTSETHRKQLRLTLLNAKKTAWWGTLFIIIPAFFLLAIFLKYALKFGFLFDPLDEYIFSPIRKSHYKFLEPLLLFVIPLIALVINIIAITHFRIEKAEKEIYISIAIKRKWWNWVIIVISAVIVGIIFLYVVKGDK